MRRATLYEYIFLCLTIVTLATATKLYTRSVNINKSTTVCSIGLAEPRRTLHIEDSSNTPLEWLRMIGGGDEDYGLGMAVDSSGYIYITGYTYSYGAGENDAFVAKLNSSGSLLWFRTIGGGYFDRGNGMALDSSGYIYITGYTSYGAGSLDAFVAKLDSSGSLLLFRTIGGSGSDYGFGIAVDPSDCIYITGETVSYGAGYEDAFVAKLNSSGSPLWFRTIGGSNSEWSKGIAVGPSGHIYITGYTESYGAGEKDAFVARLNSDLSGYPVTAHFRWQDASFSYVVMQEYSPNVNSYNPGEFHSPSVYTPAPGGGTYNPVVASQSVICYFAILDTDNDGLSDGAEISTYGTDPTDSDSDDDGLPDGTEVNTYGTNPTDSDSDNDGMPDGWEVLYGLDPLADDSGEDADSDGLSNFNEYQYGTDPTDNDSDDDGITDSLEVNTYGTDPLDSDTDDDSMPDGWEVLYGLNPLADDSGGDADSDGLTNVEEYQIGTDPLDSDTDDDSMPDGWEVLYGLNPLSAADAGNDVDKDRLSNSEEYIYGTNPKDPDTDDDGYLDGVEVENGTDPTNPRAYPTELTWWQKIGGQIISTVLGAIVSVVFSWCLRKRFEAKNKKKKERMKI
ncbi:MAG: SBBP repeat-containing protein [Candidatus Njordarchaeum guaymaensis]